MKECHFCKNKDEGELKGIYLDADIEECTDEDEKLPERSCCRNCFNDPDNSMLEAPITSDDWYHENYDWKSDYDLEQEKKPTNTTKGNAK